MNETFICRYCGRICANANSLRNHERLCKSNPDHQTVKNNLAEFNNLIREGKATRKVSNQYIKSKETGVSYELSEQTRQKLRDIGKHRRHTDDTKKRISNSMSRVAKEHPEKYSLSQIHKRTKHFTYKGFRIDGTWELIVAQYLDNENIKWTKKVRCFEYDWLGKKHNYYPDFYLPDYDKYIEVKGYETPRDIAKYKVVDNLIIIKVNEINSIKNSTFDIRKLISL